MVIIGYTDMFLVAQEGRNELFALLSGFRWSREKCETKEI